MDFSVFDEGSSMVDLPVSQAGVEDADFRVEIGFKELEIVAFIGEFKIVGLAHFGITGRASSQRPSDYLRAFSDTRLTLSQVRIYQGHATDELLDTAPFVILNLDKVDFLYAREPQDEGDAAGTPAGAAARDYAVDLLLPTARFAFCVEGDAVSCCPSTARRRRSRSTSELARPAPVVGMTTFPNTVLLRGARTILVDPGLPCRTQPVLAALEARGARPRRRRPRRAHARPPRPRRRLRRRDRRRSPSTSSRRTALVLGARRPAPRAAPLDVPRRRRRESSRPAWNGR